MAGYVPPLKVAVEVAREGLEMSERAGAGDRQVLAHLQVVLRQLLEALDAEGVA